MNYIQTISKIRSRGQLTVPQSIRQALNWSQDEMVKIVTIDDGFRVERLPTAHPQAKPKKLNKKQWNKIWQDLEEFSKLGRQDIKLTKFIRKDRDTHF